MVRLGTALEPNSRKVRAEGYSSSSTSCSLYRAAASASHTDQMHLADEEVAHALELARDERWGAASRAYTRILCQRRSESSREDRAALYAARGRCRLGADEPEAGMRDFNAAVHLAPGVATYWQNRAAARRRLGQEELAQDDGAVSAQIDAERLGEIFSELLPPVNGSGASSSPQRRATVGRTAPVLPRDRRGLPVPRKSPEQLFEQARPELREQARSYATREAVRHRDAVHAQREAAAREQERARASAQAVADAQAARQLHQLHRQYIELELAKIRSQLQQLGSHTATLAQRLEEIETGLDSGEREKAALEEDVRVIDNGSAAQRRSKRAALKREEFELAVANMETKLEKKHDLQQLQRQSVQQQEELRQLQNELTLQLKANGGSTAAG